MKYADHALYEAKSRSSGASNYVFFGKDLEKEISYTRELAEDLDEAISHNDFSVYYQPIISLTTDKICGMEAFARWFSAQGDKRYSPKQFLPIAESHNTIIELGEQLMNQVFDDIKRYRKQISRYDFLSVNFTERQLMTKEYISLISDLARSSKFDIKKLHIELTEDALIKNKSAAKRMVNKFRDAGIEIILDNFGKGYSSLSYLLEYDIKKIKIDKRVISQIDKSEHCLKLMKTIMSIAQIHDIEVIAKGVENCEQLEIVRDLGCQYAQGYFVCAPMAISKYFKFAKDYYMEKNQLSLLSPEHLTESSLQGFLH
jgi:EAL domain-containing protein (putative c-di-GMP-specific phosphodiesterase class I)